MRQDARLNSLTSLRFFAAAAVLVYHGTWLFAPSSWLGSFPGETGVTFFFVLSGFVLTWTFIATPVAAGTFYRRRFARVWPLHAVTWAGVLMLFGGHNLAAGVMTLILVQAWSMNSDVYFGVNAPSWSLSCETFFYALLPWVAPRIARLTDGTLRLVTAGCIAMLAVPAFAMAVILPAEATIWPTYVLPVYRLPEFVLGIVFAVRMRRGWRLNVPGWLAGVVLVVPLIAVTVVQRLHGPLTHGVDDLTALPGVLLVIPAAAGRDLSGRVSVLHDRMLVRLGEWSFALYLIHLPLLWLVHLSPVSLPPLLLVAVVAVLAVGGAGLLHVGVERPLERLLRNGSVRRCGTAPTVRVDRRLSYQ